jgi:hypothetical protein
MKRHTMIKLHCCVVHLQKSNLYRNENKVNNETLLRNKYRFSKFVYTEYLPFMRSNQPKEKT